MKKRYNTTNYITRDANPIACRSVSAGGTM